MNIVQMSSGIASDDKFAQLLKARDFSNNLPKDSMPIFDACVDEVASSFYGIYFGLEAHQDVSITKLWFQCELIYGSHNIVSLFSCEGDWRTKMKNGDVWTSDEEKEDKEEKR